VDLREPASKGRGGEWEGKGEGEGRREKDARREWREKKLRQLIPR